MPGFPGCVSEGDTLEETLANVRDAFEGVFAVMQERGPQETLPGDLADAVEV